MNREDILKKAQSENKGKDVADIEAQKRGAYYAYIIGICLIILVDIVEGIVLHRISYGANAAVFAMAFVAFSTKYRLLHKCHELIVMIIYGVCTLIWLVLWILGLCGVIS